MFNLFKTKPTYQELNALGFGQQLADDPQAIVLDVRTPAEFHEGHLPKAMNLDVTKDGAFAQQVAQLDKSKAYYVYCRSGVRSAKACAMLSSNGFSRVYNMARGLMSWPGQLVR